MTIPDNPIFGNLRKAGGEKVSDILIRTVTFTKRKKIYVYRPWKIKVDEKNSNKSNDLKGGNVKEEVE